VLPARVPVIFSGCTFGQSVERWSEGHLAAACADKPVSLHVSSEDSLDFLRRNYTFEVVPFADAIGRIFHPPAGTQSVPHREKRNRRKEFGEIEGEKPDIQTLTTPFKLIVARFYMRSLGENARKEPSDIAKSFPELSAEFELPDFLPREV
jgi:tRNA wybutosine-synthesizing protein 5